MHEHAVDVPGNPDQVVDGASTPAPGYSSCLQAREYNQVAGRHRGMTPRPGPIGPVLHRAVDPHGALIAARDSGPNARRRAAIDRTSDNPTLDADGASSGVIELAQNSAADS